MKLVAFAALILATQLAAQAPKGARNTPYYRGFHPGMTDRQFIEAARALDLEVSCEDIGDVPEIQRLCQSPGTVSALERGDSITELRLVAGIDTRRDQVRYLVFAEPDSTDPMSFLRGRTAEWGKVEETPGGLSHWHPQSYGMAVDTADGHLVVALGFAQVPAPGLKFMIGTVDDPPQMRQCGAMEYPDSLKTAGVSGSVVLQFIIGTTGVAERGSFKTISETHPEFVPSAIRSLMSCQFTPGMNGGIPVRVLVQQTVNFRI